MTPAEIEALAAKLEPALAKAVLRALQAQGNAVDLKALEAAIASGDPEAVLKVIAGELFDGHMAPAGAAAQNAAWTAGEAATIGTIANLKLPAVAGVTWQFDRLNPTLVTWLQAYKLSLIRQVNDGTREGIRAALLTGMTEGANPKTTAVTIKEIVGLTERQSKAVMNFRDSLETFHLRRSAKGWNLSQPIDRVNGTQVFKPGKDGKPMDAILERRLRDFRYDKALQRAMDTGKPLSPEQIDKMTAAYARKYRAYRARNIARTESIRATNIGVQEAWRQATASGLIAEGLVRRKWVVAKDERTCETCQSAVKMNPEKGVPLGAPFASLKGPVMLPPMHPGCRCTIFIRAYEASQLAG